MLNLITFVNAGAYQWVLIDPTGRWPSCYRSGRGRLLCASHQGNQSISGESTSNLCLMFYYLYTHTEKEKQRTVKILCAKHPISLCLLLTFFLLCICLDIPSEVRYILFMLEVFEKGWSPHDIVRTLSIPARCSICIDLFLCLSLVSTF